MSDDFAKHFATDQSEERPDDAPETPTPPLPDLQDGFRENVVDRQVVRNQDSGDLEIVTRYTDGTSSAEPYTDTAE